ncbi:MAG: aldehyde dehydrogenase family protein [Myxococcota bacterium]
MVLSRQSPVDLSPLPALPTTEANRLPEMVESARTAHHVWSRQRFEARVGALRRACRAMLADRARIIALVRREVGKVEADALFSEALGPLETLNHWVPMVQKALIPAQVRLNPISFPKKSGWSQLVPRGVVGIIAPWNFPVSGLYRSCFPALLMGNAILVKPSEYASESSRWFVDHLAAELPPDLARPVIGGPEIGQALVRTNIDACAFTGSVPTGRRVQVECAQRGVPCSVELGGKDFAVVLGDCALDRTIAGLTQWSLQNAGQACGAIEVAAVDQAIAEPLVSGLAIAFRGLRLGEDLAPLANERQLEVVEAQVKDALQKGAQLVCGGERSGPGLGFLPTILDHCTEDMAVVRQETFGPVLPILRVPNAYEATKLVNRSSFGLTASVWSEDVERAKKLADRLEVGVVTINNHALTGAIPELPWAGTKDSGPGIANSVHALNTFGRPKAILVDESKGPEPFWLPYDQDLVELGHRLADAQLGRILKAYRIPILLRRRAEAIKRHFGW